MQSDCLAVVAAQGFVCAIGGGTENCNSWSDAPYRWVVQKADSQRIIVLSANVEDRWIPDYFQWCGADTAFNLQIASTAVANDSATYRAIKQCRGIFIKGGDQWDYVGQWRNTLTQQAIREVFLAGGVVAGTSAGAAVLGDVVFDARVGSPVSRTALRNPRSTNITLTTDFLNLVPYCLFDTHFYERARFGRLLTMMAKFQTDSGRRILGVGLESETAVCISPDGIGEVMGAGCVTFYYPTDQTRIVTTANQPLVYTNIRYDPLVAGYKYDFNIHRTSVVPLTATVPGPGTTEPIVNAISLFGDTFPSSAGISQFITASGGPGVRFAVITPPSTSAAGQRYVDTLQSRGVAGASLILLDATSAGNSTYAAAINQAGGIVFTSNLSEPFPSYVTSSTLIGQALRSKVNAGVAAAFAHQDCKLAGSKVTLRTELEELASYRGMLIYDNGIRALRNLVVMPLIFQSDVYDWNRVSGLTWVMAKNDCKTGLYVDEGGFTGIDGNGIVQSTGSTPTIVVDTRNATHVGYSTFRHGSSVGPRQSTAIVGAMTHVIAGDYRFNAQTGTIITDMREISGASPGQFMHIQTYPNPFNPEANISFSVEQTGRATLEINNLLGQKVATLFDNVAEPLSSYTVKFDGKDLSSGVYIARLVSGSRTAVHTMTLIR